MRILITGVTGRIGANLAAALRRDGHEVRGLVWPRDPRIEKLAPLGLELQHGTITSQEDARRAVQGMQAVYHLGAAFQGGGPFTEQEYFDINVGGTFNMLEAARAAGSLRQFLFASTDAVYAKYPPGGMTVRIREDRTPRRPGDPYSLSKSVGEELCNGYFRAYKLPVTILRFPFTVGAGEIVDWPQFYLGKMRARHPSLNALWTEEERLLVARDENGRPWKKHIAEVRDIVQGLRCALGKPAAFGETFQLAGPRPFTWDEAAPYLAQKLEMPYVEADIPGPPTFYEFDISKARRVLGFRPQYDIIRMIDDALAFREGKDIGLLPT